MRKIIPICIAVCCITLSCGRSEDIRIAPVNGLVLPGITALAFNAEGSSFVSVTEDGIIRVWDVYSGASRILKDGDELAGFTSFETGDRTALSVLSPDKTKKILSADDGGIILADADTGNELARYYGFPGDEWLSIIPEGFYNASFRGSSFLTAERGKRRYRLVQLSGALFRPDLFYAALTGTDSSELQSEAPETFKNLFEKDSIPPELSLSFDETSGELKIKITEEQGGTGLIALYRRFNGDTIPAGLLLEAEKIADRKYTEKGKTCYEVLFNPAGENFVWDEIGISTFNRYNTVESEQIWMAIPQNRLFLTGANSGTSAYDSPLPVLRVLLAEGADGQNQTEQNQIEELEKYLSAQAGSGLYSGVEIIKLSGEQNNQDRLLKALDELRAGANKDDMFILLLRGGSSADHMGNFSFVPAPECEISGTEIIQAVHNLPSSRTLLLLDLAPDAPELKMETAIRRFRERLGPMTVLACFRTKDNDGALIRSVTEALTPTPADSVLGENRLISVTEFLTRTENVLAACINTPESQTINHSSFLYSTPLEDFPFADLFANTGELRFQTMTSGTLIIDRVDKEGVPLVFGDTMIRTLPGGNYIIDMIYRNGYRETRTVELRSKESKWVIFNYTPSSYSGGYSLGEFRSANIPSFGINLSELNPANYDRINREAMEGMGMAPWYVAYLAGEKFYREGDYVSAIAEYNRAISLKADYAEAFVGRGNARRRSGDLARAIEDYTRALSLNSAFAEVYNYRGFTYALRGDLNRAISDYTQAIRRNSDYADAYFNRAHAYAEQGNWDRAIADYTQVIRLEPDNRAAYNERGNAWNRKGDRAQAEADYAAAR